MIPLQLKLKNFLSYRDASLDFRGLHTACICGPNGAGKSSLLEAIAWSIWGNSRAATEDDIIHTGTTEVCVDFTFQCDEQILRVRRSRQRGQTSTLEFQIATSEDELQVQFRSLTERSLRATQQKIIQHIKIDYETFVNSAYLRQGRADEFMLKRPSERKQVLASLLRLDEYDRLAEEAKERSRDYKAQIQLLQQNQQSLETQLEQRVETLEAIATVEKEIIQKEEAQATDQEQLQQYKASNHQRHNWQQQLNWLQSNFDQLTRECQRIEQEQKHSQQRQQELEELLGQAAEIHQNYSEFEQLQSQEQVFADKLHAYQAAQKERSQLQEQLTHYLSDLKSQQQQIQAQLEALEQQKKELQNTLGQASEVAAAMTELQAARTRLATLDQLQTKAIPLIHRRQILQTEVLSRRAHTQARLEEIASQVNRLQVQQQTAVQVQQAVQQVSLQIEDLEKKRIYQQRVREKGLERRNFMERLQAQLRDREVQLADIEQKLRLLQVPDAICPLCDRPLDEHHWDLVAEKHQAQQQEFRNHIWVLREQLAVSEREIQLLRDEYGKLNRELAGADDLQKQWGGLQAQLNMTAAERERLQKIDQEKASLERSLKTGEFAGDLYTELQQIERALQELHYDEKNHALARSDVDRWRWAEIKLAQIKDAEKRLQTLTNRQPELAEKLGNISALLEQEKTESPLHRKLVDLDHKIAQIGYDFEQHKAISAARNKAQVWLTRKEQLRQAQQDFPQVSSRVKEVTKRLLERLQDQEKMMQQIDEIQEKLKECPDRTEAIKNLEQQIAQRRHQLDLALAKLGQLQQQQKHLEELCQQKHKIKHQIKEAKKQYRVYNELAIAFGKKGIQALMIENILPQLEAETNKILSRLTGNQLTCQFVTQKAGRSSKKDPKLIDTLDIVIADAHGTRPYETYSGGEAFRINFAIRLALAQLLCTRQGTRLQMLIVDEGFGTQDRQGCDRLIAAINAISPDFANILIVTHMPQFKEAFQSRIEISKTPENGSQLLLA
jgi:exonuclease SbcC